MFVCCKIDSTAVRPKMVRRLSENFPNRAACDVKHCHLICFKCYKLSKKLLSSRKHKILFTDLCHLPLLYQNPKVQLGTVPFRSRLQFPAAVVQPMPKLEAQGIPVPFGAY